MANKDTQDPEPLQQVYASMAYELIRDTILDPESIPPIVGRAFKTPAVDRVIVSYGWIGDKGIRGVCIHGPETVKDKDAVIFIRPEDWTDAPTMLTVLVHEMVHAGLELNDVNRDHKGDYEVVTAAMGLGNGGTEPDPDFLATMEDLADQLPPFPAAPLDGLGPRKGPVVVRAPNSPNAPPEPKKQKNRSRRWICDCGVNVKVARDNFQAICELCGTKFQHRPANSE